MKRAKDNEKAFPVIREGFCFAAVTPMATSRTAHIVIGMLWN